MKCELPERRGFLSWKQSLTLCQSKIRQTLMCCFNTLITNKFFLRPISRPLFANKSNIWTCLVVQCGQDSTLDCMDPGS